MKCVSCEAEINPKFKHAIEQNICPYCGGELMEQLLKNLLVSLQDIMSKMQQYPEQLNDWLLSNFDYIKTDSPELISYVPKEILKDMRKEVDGQDFDRKKRVIKVKIEDGKEVEVMTEKVQSDTKTAGFFERAQLIKRGDDDDQPEENGNMDPSDDQSSAEVQLQPIKANQPKTFKSAAERTQYLKKLKRKIETEGNQSIVGKESLAAMIDAEETGAADPVDVATLQSVIGTGDVINSALHSSSDYDDEDATTKRVLSMNLAKVSANSGKGQDGGYNAKDAQALQNLVDKAKGSSMGGGFSRRG